MAHLIAVSIATAVSAAVALSAGGVFRAQAQEEQSAARDRPSARPETRLVPQRQWEYMQLPCVAIGETAGPRRDLEDRRNEQGKRGWELVSLVEAQHPPVRGCLLATFKRPLLN